MAHIRASVPESNHRSQVSLIPDGFDPAAMPIITRHFFGWQHLDVVAERAILCIPPPEREP